MKIREFLEESINLSESRTLELSDHRDVNPRQLSSMVDKAWPDVTYKGLDIVKLEQNAERIIGRNLQAEEIQELYLGWDPKKDLFYQGFNVSKYQSDLHMTPDFYAAVIEFKVDETGSVKITNKRVRDWNTGSGGFYKETYGNKPNRIIDLRLDKKRLAKREADTSIREFLEAIKLNEATRDGDRIRFSNSSGGFELYLSPSGFGEGKYDTGLIYRQMAYLTTFPTSKHRYYKRQKTMEYTDLEREREDIRKELLKVANECDKMIDRMFKKFGYKGD